MSELPAIAIVPTPGHWRSWIEVAREAEARGFEGIYAPSLGEALALCEALALTTERLRFGTSIVNIYTRHPADYARTAAVVHELSGGRFRFGIGVSHDVFNDALGIRPGRPTSDMRGFVETLRGAQGVGELPPVVLATLRDPMIRLAGEIADGIVFANVALSRTPHSIAVLPEERRDDEDFFIGAMIATVIDDDEAAARACLRAILQFYLGLPNYRAYWRTAGYEEEMDAVEAAIAAGDAGELALRAGDRWLSDCTLSGPAAKVREGIEAWRDVGVRTPIVSSVSTSGNPRKAVEELFAAYA